jgi:hypothetical protein
MTPAAEITTAVEAVVPFESSVPLESAVPFESAMAFEVPASRVSREPVTAAAAMLGGVAGHRGGKNDRQSDERDR